MGRFPAPQPYDRTYGPAPSAPTDGLTPAGYSATLASTPANGSVKVVIPALDSNHTYTAVCHPAYLGKSGDPVLVLFDERKVPWVMPAAGHQNWPDIDP